MTRKASLLAAVLAVSTGPGAPGAFADLTADQTPFHSYRGLWVDRYDYTSNASIITMLDRARSLGITDVMFQVRGQADAYYYRSDGVEVYPESRTITAVNDPLQVAINEGHARGIKIHAWLNMMPLWKGDNPPTNPNHLYHTHPEYRARDAAGNPQELASDYVIVNPARPDVQTHLSNVVKTVAKNYDVDGIHMDYIRLYNDNSGATNPIEFPADPYTVSLFQQQYPGQTPTSHPQNYKTWMADQITELVRDVRTTTKTWRPDAQLTAAVWRDPNIGLNGYQQHWARWVDEGLLDAAMPMIYREGFATTDPGDLYRTNTTTAVDTRGSAGIMIGLGTYRQDDPANAYSTTLAQLNYAKAQGANGVQLFDYGTLFSSSTAQAEVRRALQDFFSANGTLPPPALPIADFESGEGPFRWNVTLSGSNRNIASGSADRITGDARGVGSQRIVINKTPGASSFFLRHLSGDTTAGDFNSNQQFASIGSVGVWLKTTTPDLRVSIAVDDTGTGDRGYLKNVIPDGQWHRYEWFLNDVTHWDAWTAGGNGEVEPIFAIDSVHFEGTTDATTILMDDVFHDAAAAAPDQWTFNGNGNWSHSGNWTGGAPGISAGSRGETANLLRRATAARAISLDVPVTLGTLNIDNSSSYTIAGPAALSFDAASGSAAINVINRGSHAIDAETALIDSTSIFVDRGSTLAIGGTLRNDGGRTITKSGDGTLVLKGLQQHGPGAGITVEAGKLVLERNLGGAAGNRNAHLTVSAAGVAEIRSRQHLSGLSIAGGSARLAGAAAQDAIVHTSALSISAGGTLDVDRQSLIVRPGAQSRAAVLQEIEDHVRSARNAVTRWGGPGITSSAAIANALTGLAVVLNDDGAGGPLFETYRGEALDANAVIVDYTWNGDANLDGLINADDYFRLDSGFLAQRANPSWRDGDFNYDNTINADDYFLIDSAFLGQTGSLAASSVAAVPEPSAAALVLALPLLFSRRRPRIRDAR